MRYLAIDHGQKRTGLALCDADETMAFPLVVVDNSNVLLRKLKEVVDEYRIQAIVMGLPFNMDGTEGPRAQEVKRFARQMQKEIDLPVHFFDERLSSFSAERKLGELELTRKKKKKRLDAVAAAEILQGFLDHKARPEHDQLEPTDDDGETPA